MIDYTLIEKVKEKIQGSPGSTRSLGLRFLGHWHQHCFTSPPTTFEEALPNVRWRNSQLTATE